MATVNFIRYEKQSVATMRGVMGYVCQTFKTTSHTVSVPLVSGKDCVPDHAVAEFLATKAVHNKIKDVQFYHYTQSFKAGLDISPHLVHQIALEFAEKNFPGHEVLVATHMDTAHLHTHFIINSVSFETGKKLHQPPNTLRKLRQSSDEICKAHGLEILPPYEHGRTNTKSRAEKRADQQGISWKGELMRDIASTMKTAKTKREFWGQMEGMGYGIKWTDTRKHITYTHPNGKSCRDKKLYGKRFSKENMEQEFEIRRHKQTATPPLITGWEQERTILFAPLKPLQSQVLREAFWAMKRMGDGMEHGDDLQLIANIGVLTMLSFVGVYLLFDCLSQYNEAEIDDETFDNIVEELKQEPENNQGYEEQHEEPKPQQQQGFTMTMGGF
ncbi:relaxase/mobilization nuclease domain-containing protein [Bengtsoniella intestinalis]|uniref:relaxase/mobilization nuclease domain-containing protein n=1 Tax=Bengtsoniella intestinalis TaxID=3073143 RepID=UPI00391F8C04